MQHDLRLRAAARAIYDNVYPPADPAPFSFDEAERFGFRTSNGHHAKLSI
jgi:hypothetical protein